MQVTLEGGPDAAATAPYFAGRQQVAGATPGDAQGLSPKEQGDEAEAAVKQVRAALPLSCHAAAVLAQTMVSCCRCAVENFTRKLRCDEAGLVS